MGFKEFVGSPDFVRLQESKGGASGKTPCVTPGKTPGKERLKLRNHANIVSGLVTRVKGKSPSELLPNRRTWLTVPQIV